MATLKNTTIDDTGHLKLPSGTTSQRPASPVAGMQRWNTDLGAMEYYNGTSWSQKFVPSYNIEYLLVGGGGAGGGGDNFVAAAGGSGGAVTGSVAVFSGDQVVFSIGGGGGGGAGGVAGTGAGSAGGGSVGPGGRGGNAGSIGSSGGGGGGGGGTFMTVSGVLTAAAGGGSGGGGSYEGDQNEYGGSGGGSQPRGNTGSFSGGQGFDYSGDGGGGGGGGGGRYGGVGQDQDGASSASGGGNYHGGNTFNAATFTGNDGGANSISSTSPVTVTNASAWGYSNNYGGGGAGAGGGSSGGDGSQGIAIIKYAGSQRGTGGTVTTVGGYTVHTFTSDGTFTAFTNGSGSITLSTPQDIATSSNVQFGSIGIGTAASGSAGEIRATNAITAYYSDDNLKTRLGNIENALEKVLTLDGFYYEANQTAQELGYTVKKEVGVSAQQVQAVLPEVVVPAPISDKYLTVHYERLVPLLIEAIKELKQEIDSMKRGV